MAHLIRDDIDFLAYVKETEGQEKVRPAAEFVRQLIDKLGKYDHEPKAYFPWPKTHQLVQLRPGEVSLWAGVNGDGKSLMTGMVAQSLMSQGERVCIASFEMKPATTLARMSRQWAGDTPTGEWRNEPEVIAEFTNLYQQFSSFTENRLWLYDQQGTVQTNVLIGVLRYCAKELRIQHMFIDSLMKCVKDEDDYNAQKAFVDELTAIARDHGMHVHLVHHIRKLTNEDTQPDKTDVKGSGSITDQVDNVFLVWRNRKKEREAQAGKTVAENEPDATLKVAKQRNGEWEGVIKLWMHRQSQQFVESGAADSMKLYNWPHRA